MNVEQKLQYPGERLKHTVHNTVGKAMLAFSLLTATGAAIAADSPQFETYLPTIKNDADGEPIITPSPTLTPTPTETVTPVPTFTPTPTVTPTLEPTPTPTAIPPEFGMTVPSEYAVAGQISGVEKIAASYPGFPYLLDWWNGTDKAGILSNKCNLDNYIPMIYSPSSTEPPAACKDGRILILGNECNISGQCNATEDEEYQMWVQYRSWNGPVVLCNYPTGYQQTSTRCANLLARYKAQFGSFPANTYLGLHTYAQYLETNIPGLYDVYLYTDQIQSYYNLSKQYNLKRFIGEWGFWGIPTTDLENRIVQDMEQTAKTFISYYNPEIMMYFTTRVEPADNLEHSVGNLLGQDGNLTPIGEEWFKEYYQGN